MHCKVSTSKRIEKTKAYSEEAYSMTGWIGIFGYGTTFIQKLVPLSSLGAKWKKYPDLLKPSEITSLYHSL
jgi:hypothetical protein